MITDKIVKLSRQAITQLLQSREAMHELAGDYDGAERRGTPRMSWPFPGTVEIRPLGANDDELCFATCRDVSLTGVGMTCEQGFEPGTPLEIAIHLAEGTFYGTGTVRYCAEVEPRYDLEDQDWYALGIEFNFDQ